MISNSPLATQKIAEDFISCLVPQSELGATVVGLYGDLGAGKTTFMKGVALALGVVGEVTSPTFVIQKIYKLEDQKFDKLIHIDAYRIDSPLEMKHIGWQGILSDDRAIVFIEWAERLEDILPINTHRIKFISIDENQREIIID